MIQDNLHSISRCSDGGSLPADIRPPPPAGRFSFTLCKPAEGASLAAVRMRPLIGELCNTISHPPGRRIPHLDVISSRHLVPSCHTLWPEGGSAKHVHPRKSHPRRRKGHCAQCRLCGPKPTCCLGRAHNIVQGKEAWPHGSNGS